MRKIVLIYLLLALSALPFIKAAGASCHTEDRGHFCTMYGDMQEHRQEADHCHGCHLTFWVPAVQQFSFEETENKLNRFLQTIELKHSDNPDNLYRPPIV